MDFGLELVLTGIGGSLADEKQIREELSMTYLFFSVFRFFVLSSFNSAVLAFFLLVLSDEHKRKSLISLSYLAGGAVGKGITGRLLVSGGTKGFGGSKDFGKFSFAFKTA